MAGAQQRIQVYLDIIARETGMAGIRAAAEREANRLAQTAQSLGGSAPTGQVTGDLQSLQTAVSRMLTQASRTSPTLLGPNGQPLSGPTQAASAQTALNAAIQALVTRLNAAIQTKFGGVPQGVAQQAQAKIDAARKNAVLDETLSGSSQGAQEFRSQRAREIRARALLAAMIQEEIVQTRALAESKAREASARARLRQQTAEASNDPTRVLNEANARLAERRLRNAQDLATVEGTTVKDTAQAAALTVAQRRLSANRARAEVQNLAGPAGQQILATEATVAAARARQRVQVEQATQQALAGDRSYAQATAAVAQARAEQAARVSLERAGINSSAYSGNDLVAAGAAAEKAQADLRAAAAANAAATADIGGARAAVAKRNSEARLRAAEAQMERAYIKAALQTGQLAGSPFQRLQARFSPTPRSPEEFQKFGQFVGQKVVATAGYGIGASLFYGSLSGIGNLIQEAGKLQQIFVQIDNQLRSLGQGASIDEVKEQVLGIARSTGVASDEVGKVAFQFIGAFGGDTPKALKETEAAMKGVQVTGLALGEVVDSLTAISLTYTVSIEKIFDVTLGLQERFGVLSKEIITFVGDTAAVGQEAGFALEDLAAIGAIAQQQSGKTGAVLAEQFNRIIPALTDSKTQILSLYDVLGQGPDAARFQKGYDRIVESLGQGDSSGVFKQITEDFSALDQGERNALIRQLGGRREAQTLIAILRESEKLLGEFSENEKNAERDAGKLNDKFEEIQQTLLTTGARLGEAFKQIGEALLSGGIGEVLVDLGNGFITVFSIISSGMALFSSFNEALNGIPGDILKIVAVAALLTKAFGALSGLGLGASLRNTFVTAARSATGASQAQAAAQNAVAAAAAAQTTAVGAAAAANASLATSANAATAASTAQASTATATSASRAFNVFGGPAGRAYGPAPGVGPGVPPPGPVPAAPLVYASRATGFAGAIPFYGTANPNSFASGYNVARAGGASRVGAAGAGLAPAAGQGAAVAAFAAAGAIAVNSSYQENRAPIEQAAQSLKEQLLQADISKVQELADSHTETMDRVAIRFFGQELPEETAQAVLNIRTSSEGRYAAEALAGDDKLLSAFRTGISDANLGVLEEFYSQGAGSGAYGLGAAAGSPAAFAEQFGLIKTDAKGKRTVNRDALTKENIDKIRAKAEEGDFAAGETVKFIDDVLQNQSDLADLNDEIDELVKSGKAKEAYDAAGGAGGFIAAEVNTVKAQAAAGLASDFDVERALKSRIKALRNLKETGSITAFTEQDEVELANAEGEIRKSIAARIQRRLDAAEQLRELGGNVSAEADLQALVGALGDTRLGANEKAELLPQAIEALKARFEEELAGIKDPLARAQRALDGYDVPPEIQALLAGQQLQSNLAFSDTGFAVAEAVGVSMDEVTSRVYETVTTTEKNVQEAVLEILDAKILELMTKIAQIASAGGGASDDLIEQLNNLQTLRDETADKADLAGVPINAIAKIFNDAKEAEAEVLKSQQDRANALLDVASARASGNPEAEAQVAIDRALTALRFAQQSGDPNQVLAAEAQLISARKSAVSAAFGVAKAEAGLLQVMADGDPVLEAQAQIQAAYVDLQQALASGDRAGVISADGAIRAGQQAARDAANDIVRSQIELANEVNGAGIAGELALADFDIATARGEAERNRAILNKIQLQKQEQQEILELEQSRFAVAAAIVERDPLKSAQIAVQQADAQARAATTEAERNNAMAAQISAQHQLEDAIAAIAQAQSNLLRAMAEYAGDSVEAARIGLRAAEEELNRLTSNGSGQEAIDNQKANVLQQKAALRDATLNDRLGDIDYLQQIGDISTAQAIEMLESVAQIPDLTEEQLRSIRLKIKGLQSELSRDFQFNLPTLLGNPTLYEARRVNQTNAAGIGYQDNRNIQINVTAQGPDAGQVAQQVVSEIGQALQPGTVTTGTRRY